MRYWKHLSTIVFAVTEVVSLKHPTVFLPHVPYASIIPLFLSLQSLFHPTTLASRPPPFIFHSSEAIFFTLSSLFNTHSFPSLFVNLTQFPIVFHSPLSPFYPQTKVTPHSPFSNDISLEILDYSLPSLTIPLSIHSTTFFPHP